MSIAPVFVSLTLYMYEGVVLKLLNSLVMTQKGNLKMGVTRKYSTPNFPKNEHNKCKIRNVRVRIMG